MPRGIICGESQGECHDSDAEGNLGLSRNESIWDNSISKRVGSYVGEADLGGRVAKLIIAILFG